MSWDACSALPHAAASEMAQGNQDLSQRTEETAANLDRTAAALEQITRNLQDSSEGLSQAKDLAAQAASQAVAGGTLVAGLVERMHHIEQEAARDSDIVSLNAAVEAARAGEHGRGFALSPAKSGSSPAARPLPRATSSHWCPVPCNR